MGSPRLGRPCEGRRMRSRDKCCSRAGVCCTRTWYLSSSCPLWRAASDLLARRASFDRLTCSSQGTTRFFFRHLLVIHAAPSHTPNPLPTHRLTNPPTLLLPLRILSSARLLPLPKRHQILAPPVPLGDLGRGESEEGRVGPGGGGNEESEEGTGEGVGVVEV
ncbi:hypothetical protein BJY59DRAFT_698577 [Rhodotorula toruloides]